MHLRIEPVFLSLFLEANTGYLSNEERNAMEYWKTPISTHITHVSLLSCHIRLQSASILEITCHRRLAILILHPVNRSHIICPQSPLTLRCVSSCMSCTNILLRILIILLHLHLSHLWPSTKLRM